MTMKTLLTASAATLVLSVPVLAHHSAAAYDTQKQVTVTGTLAQYRYTNPHIYMTLQVRKDDGSTSMLEVEAGAASVLNGLGFTKNSVKVGEVVKVVGNPSRREPDKQLLGKDLYREDGSYVPLNIASRSIYDQKNAEAATSIAGTWFAPFSGFGGFLGGTRRWPLTDAGKAAAAVPNDPKATTQKDCIPIGEPGVMFYPVANAIKVEKDKVVIRTDWMDTERTVYLDGRKHPAPTQLFLHGHSVGHWEGKTLVVETTNFKEHPMGNSTSLPSSAQKKLVEKFTLGADGKSLDYSGTLEDPVYIAQPVQFSGKWEYRPTMPLSGQKCNVDLARRFLKD